MAIDRKFFHDCANLLSISKGMAAIAKTLIDSKEPAGVEKAAEKLAKAINALDRLEKLVMAEKVEFKKAEDASKAA